ncbi:hypothetical protein Acr_18g0004680 [Actinidia rufa]|uniref:Gnk2-homologous domain-containing protein n=1 Tax=Actinidia rufa TaxID=165716 RepID=A0A7J0G685_9ERIC|nr:hypothetical protein Acr_18g0004680 [Actinidia rufa]
MGTSIFPIIVSCIITILPLTTAQFCSGEFNFTANNTFLKTRNLVLSSLASNVSANRGFFGAILALDSDTLYTLGLCRGDLSNNSCFSCISTSSQSLIDKCPNNKEATGIEYSCMVRYSNRPFFNVMDTHPARCWQNPNNVSANHMENFNWVLNRLVDELIVRVVAGSSILRFTTGDNNFTVYDNRIYALMQCVPTLSPANRSNTYRTTIIIVGVILSIILLVIALCAAFLLLRKKEEAKRRHNSGSLYNLARVRAAAKIFWTSRRNGMHQAGVGPTKGVHGSGGSVCPQSVIHPITFGLEIATPRTRLNPLMNPTVHGLAGCGRVGRVKFVVI